MDTPQNYLRNCQGKSQKLCSIITYFLRKWVVILVTLLPYINRLMTLIVNILIHD